MINSNSGPSDNYYSELYKRAVVNDEQSQFDYDKENYTCNREEHGVVLDLPSVPRNERIWRHCEQCERMAFFHRVD